IGELSVHAPFVGMTQSFWQDNERYLDSYWRTIPGIWVHGDLAMHREDGHWFMLGRSDAVDQRFAGRPDDVDLHRWRRRVESA
ncbi:hypothetical protein ACWGS9_35920, partial [Bradyrhizobium sp. Arg314]